MRHVRGGRLAGADRVKVDEEEGSMAGFLSPSLPPAPPLGPPLVRTRDTLENAKAAISKELIWKVHFEAAQIEERAASLCRHDLAGWRYINDRLNGPDSGVSELAAREGSGGGRNLSHELNKVTLADGGSGSGSTRPPLAPKSSPKLLAHMDDGLDKVNAMFRSPAR